MEAYTERGIALLWVLPYNKALIDGRPYRPSSWECYLHALYRRTVFYWTPAQRLLPVSYQSITTTGEAFHWYDDKEDWLYAGQPKRSKRFRRLELHPEVDLIDLVAVDYPAWETDRIHLPAARLWTRRPVSSLEASVQSAAASARR